MIPLPDILQKICHGLREATEIGEGDDGSVNYELPLSYTDGVPLNVTLRSDGVISDGGRTLLRLVAEGQLDALEEWDEWSAYRRMHNIERRRTELVFSGKADADLLAYLQGLRDLEVVVPRDSSRSDRFDYAVRRAVKERVSELARERRIPEETAETMVKPTYSWKLKRPRGPAITLTLAADFANMDASVLFVILSHGADSSGGKASHINQRLAEHFAAKKKQIRAIVPKDEYFDEAERALIYTYTQSEPIEVRSDDVEPIVRAMRTTSKPGMF